MRFWEALEEGAVPIIEKVCFEKGSFDSDETATLREALLVSNRSFASCEDSQPWALGRYAQDILPYPGPKVRMDWSDAPEVLQRTDAHIDEVASAVLEWHQNVKHAAKHAVSAHIMEFHFGHAGRAWSRMHNNSFRARSTFVSGIGYVVWSPRFFGDRHSHSCLG